MAQRTSNFGVLVRVGLTIICALIACDLAIAILRNSASLFPGKDASYKAKLLYYPMSCYFPGSAGLQTLVSRQLTCQNSIYTRLSCCETASS